LTYDGVTFFTEDFDYETLNYYTIPIRIVDQFNNKVVEKTIDIRSNKWVKAIWSYS